MNHLNANERMMEINEVPVLHVFKGEKLLMDSLENKLLNLKQEMEELYILEGKEVTDKVLEVSNEIDEIIFHIIKQNGGFKRKAQRLS